MAFIEMDPIVIRTSKFPALFLAFTEMAREHLAGKSINFAVPMFASSMPV